NQVTAAQKAQTEANTLAAQGRTLNAAIAADLTEKYKQQAQGLAQEKVEQDTLNNQDSIAFVKAETASLGDNNDARTTMLAHLQAEQNLKKQGVDLESEVPQKCLSSVDALSAATTAYDNQKQALSDIASAFSSAFDQIGQ